MAYFVSGFSFVICGSGVQEVVFSCCGVNEQRFRLTLLEK